MGDVYDAEPDPEDWVGIQSPVVHTYLVGDWWNGGPNLGTMRTFHTFSEAVTYANTLQRQGWIRIYETYPDSKPVRMKYFPKGS